MNILDLDRQLNTMIMEGKSVDAFQTFYDEHVVAQENDDAERVGRDAGWPAVPKWRKTSRSSTRG